ncbi:TPA: helix-turn-helix domain-containing protein [Aeromonas veronii]|nr:helix-turn-helix domain-containing protein [Aeromonas veronii]
MTDGRQKQTLRIASSSIAAILEKHKEGMSNNAIAKLFDMNPMTVGRILADQEACNKMRNPQNVTPESSTSAVPMASTEDRSDTREDAPLRKMPLGQISKSDPRTT